MRQVVSCLVDGSHYNGQAKARDPFALPACSSRDFCELETTLPPPNPAPEKRRSGSSCCLLSQVQGVEGIRLVDVDWLLPLPGTRNEPD